MSAIAGIYQFNQEPVDVQHGQTIMSALHSFHADYVHTWSHDHVFLGCHAQWITPESVDERLPYYDPVRQLVITADAIIDNREELFDQLQVDREKRVTIPDSELILLAYQKWGEASPGYLIGDFVFMIWDQKKNQLFGARDFSGCRTLYYSCNGQRFTFCTIMGPLFTLPHAEKKLNEEWLAEYLAIPNMIDTIDAGSTVYQSIKQIPPSHSIIVKDGNVTLTRYCTLDAPQQLRLKSNEEYEEAFREVFGRAVASGLRTHRHVGAQLSGGLDSGSVVSFAARALSKQNRRLYTFSSIPEEHFKDWTRSYSVADERPFIQSTVQHVGNITDHYLDFTGKNPLSVMDEWLEIMEMPYKFFENSVWIKGIYEEARQQGIGVLLTGARGNFTISWGPALDYYASLMKRLKWIRLYQEVNLYSKNSGALKSRVLKVAAKKAFPFIKRVLPGNLPYELPVIVGTELAKRTHVFEKLEEHGIPVTGSVPSNIYEARKKHFEKLYLWNTTGTSSTKLSLRYSLRGRDPTNDLRLIRFCLSVPVEQFVQDGFDRALVRRSTKGFLPDKVRLNQRFRGIQGADIVHRMAASWPAFIGELQRMSTDSAVSGMMNVDEIKAAISRVGKEPRPEYAFDPDFKILMRSLIVYRFMKNNA